MVRLVAHPRKLHIAVAALALLIAGGLLCWRLTHRVPRMVYVSEGYGGYVPADQAEKRSARPAKPANPLQPAVDAYSAGRYKQAETEALRVIQSQSEKDDPSARKEVARARYVLAFSAARRNDLALARDRFAVLKREASKLPEGRERDTQPGQPSPTLEEEAAYQHAVCTAALGDKKAAEAEYIRFMRDYPESPLIHGAIKRIELLHDGHLPREAEAVWTEAMQVAQERQKERQKQAAMCGPECLAEILRRQGKTVDVKTLAEEMKITEYGTSLAAVAKVAERYGFSARGLALSQKGLRKQPLPLIALVMPGHYVLVEEVTWKDVSVWDAHGNGVGKPATRRYPVKQWKQMWQGGIALVLTPRIARQPDKPHR